MSVGVQMLTDCIICFSFPRIELKCCDLVSFFSLTDEDDGFLEWSSFEDVRMKKVLERVFLVEASEVVLVRLVSCFRDVWSIKLVVHVFIFFSTNYVGDSLSVVFSCAD
ncbi:hypothetical protein [Crucivirus-506]|nr:hypothetical protein [Crucivirus-505]QMW68989.1 hypothetical protein [Crucivirus-506]